MPSNKAPIKIVADDRERKSGIIEALSVFENVSVRNRRLSRGDYQVNGRLIVERKTVKDFTVSIIDGRLFTQMVRMKKSNFMGVLIIEGVAKDLLDTGIPRKAMQGALITVSLIIGIPVLRSMDAVETAGLIVYMARQLCAAAGGSMLRNGYQPKGKRRRQLYILQGLPGIGRERAIRLLDKFGSVEAVITADSSALQSVHGIGKGVAEKIRWAVSE